MPTACERLSVWYFFSEGIVTVNSQRLMSSLLSPVPSLPKRSPILCFFVARGVMSSAACLGVSGARGMLKSVPTLPVVPMSVSNVSSIFWSLIVAFLRMNRACFARPSASRLLTLHFGLMMTSSENPKLDMSRATAPTLPATSGS